MNADRRQGSRVARARATATLALCAGAGLVAPAVAHAQNGRLERWTVGYLTDGWAPRWGAHGDADGPSPGEPWRVAAVSRAETLDLRSSLDQGTASARVSVRQPISRSFALRLGAATGGRRARTDGRTLAETPWSQAIAGGLEMAEEMGPLGTLRLVALAGWDGGAGGEAAMTLHGPHLSVGLAGWTLDARDTRVLFPADSLGDLGVSQVATGVRARASATLRLGPVTVRPAGTWQREELDDRQGAEDAYLRTSPAGASSMYGFGLQAAAGAWSAEGRYRKREIDLESTLLRNGATAGRLFLARVELRRWSGRLARSSGPSRWSVEVAGEESEGELSTRVETWPFVGLWGQLSAIAYRLRGRLDARSLGVALRRDPVTSIGWSWGGGVTRYEARVGRDSWFVTSLGFGRSGREVTASGVDPALVVGADLGRTLTARGVVVDVVLEGGVPVHATELAGPQPATGEGGLAGYLGLTLGWRW